MTGMIVKFDDENLSNFDLFLDFFQVTGTDVIDSYRWSGALRLKVEKMHTAYEDVLRQIPIWQADHVLMQKRGIGSSKEGNILALRYETFLHSVYSLCETLSRVTVRFYPTLSHSFREQKNELLGKKNSVDPQYAKILESVGWFDEVRAIRSEATHFLSGIITISKNGEPGYFNTPKNKREGSLQEISKESIEKHISEIYQNVATFLTQFGDHFIQKIDSSKKIAKPCLLNGEKFMGAREFTLNDVRNKTPGICHLPLYECPVRHMCDAFKATPVPVQKTDENG
jgi:hypothetical protein